MNVLACLLVVLKMCVNVQLDKARLDWETHEWVASNCFLNASQLTLVLLALPMRSKLNWKTCLVLLFRWHGWMNGHRTPPAALILI